jgi:hypothetical protein
MPEVTDMFYNPGLTVSGYPVSAPAPVRPANAYQPRERDSVSPLDSRANCAP